jgi:hypothetical protein
MKRDSLVGLADCKAVMDAADTLCALRAALAEDDTPS